MEKSVLEAIKRFSLLEGGIQTVTVALSGGADSVALLYALYSLKEELGITVKAAHLNHLIRGDEAFRDEEFVVGLCQRLGIDIIVKREDVPFFAKEKGISTELAARKLRYEFLESVANDGVVATAHTASDNLETVILNLTRGTGIDGLCGIPPKRGKFIRPVILSTREQIEEYCEKNSLSFVTDSTNLADEYTRNKIRHSIVPLLKELNPSVEKTVLRSSAVLREDSVFLKNFAEGDTENRLLTDGRLSVDGLDTLNTAIAKRIIKGYIERINPEISPESSHIEEAYNVAKQGGRTSLPKNFSFVVVGSVAWLEYNECPKKVGYKVSLTECDNQIFKKRQKINNLLLNNLLDCDKIIGNLVVRTRMPGDIIRISGRGCTKTLNKLYNECAVPVALRETLPVIADDKGVLWVCGIGVAQRIAVNRNSKRVMRIDVETKTD